jgi:hypothetical protein
MWDMICTWYDNPINPAEALHICINGIRAEYSVTVDAAEFAGSSLYNLVTFGSPNNVNNTEASIDEFMFWDE